MFSLKIKLFNNNLLDDFEKSFDIKAKNAFIWTDEATLYFKNLYSIASIPSSAISLNRIFVNAIMEKSRMMQLLKKI